MIKLLNNKCEHVFKRYQKEKIKENYDSIY